MVFFLEVLAFFRNHKQAEFRIFGTSYITFLKSKMYIPVYV